MGPNGTGPRRLSSWIDSFVSYTEDLFIPPIYAKWSAISAIAGALERKVWVHTRGSTLYPNLYIMLVGPPAAGKSISIKEVRAIWSALGGSNIHLAPASLTSASLIDVINEAKRKIVRPSEDPPYIEYHSLSAAITEFSEFAPLYDPAFMSRLQVLWDCDELSERRRGKPEGIKIPNTQLNLLAGTTPSYLNTFMPDGAWDQGFISRTIMIFHSQEVQVNLFSTVARKDTIAADLKNDLNLIVRLFGQMRWRPEAAKVIQQWVDTGRGPLPEHARLAHYNARRIVNVVKLCMIFSIARSNELVIEPVDFDNALQTLVEAEFFMPEIFRSMSASSESQVMEDAYHYLISTYMKAGEPILDWKMVEFLRTRCKPADINKTIEIMVKSHMMETAIVGNGIIAFKPILRQ